MEKPLKYSAQAQVLISNMKDFPREEFEAWYKENVALVAGDRTIMEFLYQREALRRSKAAESGS